MKVTAAEELLIARCVRKDREAIELLGSDYAQPLYTLIVIYLGGDVSYAGYLILSHFRSDLNAVDPFGENVPLLVRILSAMMPSLRKFIRPKEIDPGFAEEVKLSKDQIRITNTLLALPSDDVLALLMRDQLLCSYEEIAAALNYKKKDLKDVILSARQLVQSKATNIPNQES